MLGIKVNDTFLTLSPGAQMQLERESPFFNIDNLASEYSMPVTIPYTPQNARALGMFHHYYTRRTKTRFPAQLYDRLNFCYTGELVIDSASIDLNDTSQSTISGNFITGVSSFYQLVKNKKLSDLKLGGIRSFAWTDNNPVSVNKGWWQHVHDTWEGKMDYLFAPIRNEKWTGSGEDGTADWMNKLGNNGYLDFEGNYNTLCPQVRLRYILEQIFAEHGWSVDYSEVKDTQWQTIFIPTFYAVTWEKMLISGPAPLNTIEMNLQNHMPPDVTITSFIIWLRNKYNWGFDFDSGRKVCKLYALKALANGKRKDWTTYLNKKVTPEFTEDKKVFAFNITIGGNDSYPIKQDMKQVTVLDPVAYFTDLPVINADMVNKVIHVYRENTFYQATVDDDGTTYQWVRYADNISGYSPDGNNVSYDTEIGTMPVIRLSHRYNGSVNFYGLFPVCEQEGNWMGKAGEKAAWGIRTLFYFGMVYEARADNAPGLIKYPYLTSVIYAPTNVETPLVWSDVTIHIVEGTQDVGIYQYWWYDSIQYLQEAEVLNCTLRLPRQELIDFRWSDVIILRSIKYVVSNLPDLIPYTGQVEAKMRRIG